MLWLAVSILSYLFFALAYLGDKIILVKAPTPKSYTFYVGFFSGLVVLLIPFISFSFPSMMGMVWVIADAIVYVGGLYVLFVALEKYDVSRVIPAVGATQPILVYFLTCVFFGFQPLSRLNIFAFILLLVGGVVISLEKSYKFSKDSLKLSLFAALLFSLDFIFSKLVFEEQPFLQGFIWIRIISFIIVILLLFDKSFRKDVFKKDNAEKETGVLFFLTQGAGGLATILQSYSIKIVPLAYLAIMNSLRGTQYVFVFVLTILSSVFYPKALKENISRKAIWQKSIAIILIFIGLAILVTGA